MNQEPARFILYFNHIPKTGGTSLRSWLNSLFLDSEIYPHLHHQPDHPVPLVKSGLQLITGHHACNVHEDGLGGFHEVTWIREPRAWVRSYYKFVRTFDYGSLPPGVPIDKSVYQIKKMSYPEFLEEFGRPGGNLSGFQSRYLYTCSPIQPETEPYETVRRKSENRLKEFAIVGSLGHMQESVDLFCHRFKLPPKRFLLWENRSQSVLEIDSTREELFLSRNADVDLYKTVSENVLKDFAEMTSLSGLAGEQAGSDAVHDRLRNEFCLLGNPHFHRRCLQKNQAILGEGWGPVFLWGTQRPRMIRWAQNSRSFGVFIPVCGSGDHLLEFDLLIHTILPIEDSLSLSAGNGKISYTLASISDPDFEQAFRLSAVIRAEWIPKPSRFFYLEIQITEEAYRRSAEIHPDPVYLFATDLPRTRSEIH